MKPLDETNVTHVWYNSKLNEIAEFSYVSHLFLKIYEDLKPHLIYLGVL